MLGSSYLKNYFAHASIQSKLSWLIGSAAILVLLFVATILSVRETIQHKKDIEQELGSIAQLVSGQNTRYLVAKNHAALNDSLTALKNQRGIIAAFIYDYQGELAASFQTENIEPEKLSANKTFKLIRNNTLPKPSLIPQRFPLNDLSKWLQTDSSTMRKEAVTDDYSEVIFLDDHGHLVFIKPILRDNKFLGSLQLVDDLTRLDTYLADFYWVTTLVVLIALFAVMLLASRLQRFLSEPLLNLMYAMQVVAEEKKFTGHVTKATDDEIGQLVDAYNKMLDELHHRDELLQWQRETLASQVKDRTAQLSQKNKELETVAASAVTAKEEAEAANKAKSQFLANVSHEIRTPINAVLGMTDFLAQSELRSEQRKSVEVMRQSSTLLLNIINDILDFSKIESGKLNLSNQEFICLELLTNCFDLLKLDAQSKNLKYRMQQNTEIPHTLIGDDMRIGQILVNLLSNAVKFTSQGEVVLDITCEPQGAHKVRLTCKIIDTGIGISADKLSLIFDAFSQADNTMTRIYQGTGLGLSISKQLVQLMGGQIGVNSQPGIGSTFWFWIDLKKGKSLHKKTKDKTNYRYNAKLLVAEDYPANQLVVQRFLEDLGCQVHLVNNGFEAVKAIKNEQFDLVFMDCQMPFMDGYQATEEIRRHEIANGPTTHIPIIALTAHALAEDEAKCKEAGMDEWVTKPFTRQDLSKTLLKWLPKELVVADQPPLTTDIATLAKASKIVDDSNVTAINLNFFTKQFKLNNKEDIAFITSLTEAFQQNAAHTLSQMQIAIENEDAENIRKLAHGMKSLSANVGSGNLTELCKKMEEAGKSKHLQGIQELLEAMKQEYLRALTELTAFCAKT